MKVHYVIVLIKICPDAGNDFSIILCSFGSLLLRGFKVISHIIINIVVMCYLN